MKNISVDSDLGIFADAITISTSNVSNSLTNVIKKTPKKTRVSLGFGDDQNNPDEITKDVDVYLLGLSLSISATGNISTNLSCQDSSYKLQNTFFKKIFFYRQPVNTQGQLYNPKDELEEDIDFEVGKKTVKDIIEDVVSVADSTIKVVWEPGVENYTIVDKNHPYQSYDSTVSGVISTLLAPLQHTDMYRVTALMINKTLHIRKQYISGKARKISMNFEEIYGKEVSINYSRVVGADIKHIIIEYSKDSDVDVSVVTKKTIENVINPQTNLILSSNIKYTDSILDVVIAEREELYRGVDGNVVLVSYTETTYTYDVPPDELDEDGRFQTYRKLIAKIISQKNYLSVFTPTESLSGGQKITDVVGEVDTLINYGYSSNDELVQETEETTNRYYGAVSDIKKIDTVYKQIKSDLVETLRTTFINDTASTMISIITEGKLQRSSRLLYNENSNPYFQKKYIKEDGTGESKDQVVYLSSEYLSLSALKLIAKEIIEEREYIKITITINGLSMPWLNRGDEITFSGKLIIHRVSEIESPVLIVGTNVYEIDKKEIIRFSDISDTPLIVENQNFSMDTNGSLGSITLIGYKELG